MSDGRDGIATARRITRFEDLIAWQKARSLTSAVYKLTNTGGFVRDYGLKDQMRRSSASVMSNIAEGFERGRPAEFDRFLSIAKGSCAELRSQMYVALDAGYIARDDFDLLHAQADEVGRIVGGLRASAERRRER